jgi:hydrogenase nickel incorporation protein HypB
VGRFHGHGSGPEHHHGGAPEPARREDRPHPANHNSSHDEPPVAAAREVGDHSGYEETGPTRVSVLRDILWENDRVADENRLALDAARVRAVNLMSSPGAGKTTLLRGTVQRLSADLRIGVLEGDIATSIDADRLADSGARAVSLVNTSAGFGGECHLDAIMVRAGLSRLRLGDLDLLLIENVGNLVCPAEFRVGEHAKAMVYAITEGEDKPLKYPVMFRAVDVVVVNKMDLLPHLCFDLDAFVENVHAVNPDVPLIEVSATTGDGLDTWCAWLRGQNSPV